MNMKDVKAITIPQGTVKKIEDSNGNIIWGSYDAFPYRRLEYIHFNGTNNYINFGTGKPSYNKIDTIVAKILSAPSNGTFGGYSVDGAWPRYYLPRFANGTQLRFVVSAAWSKYINYSLNTKYKFTLKTGASLSAQCTCELRNGDTDALIDSDTITPSQQSGGTTANNPVIFVGAQSNKTTSGGTAVAAAFVNCDFYLWRRTALDGTSNLYHAYPAQRKSDGAIGLWWPQSRRFDVMQGTINSSSAGPVVDEYWDGTDPNPS